DEVGGPLVDLHVHDAHLIRMMFGMPNQCHTRRRNHPETGVPQLVDSAFAFDDESLVVSATGGVIDQAARPFTHGFEAHFEHACVQFEFSAYANGQTAMIPLTVISADGIQQPDLGDGDPVDAFIDEIDAVATAMSGGAVHPALELENAIDAIKICEMQER
ncbi:MAG: gfo/Idh/MocA family oxidoreductase, partial [Planctomycetota bacterium]